MSVGKPLLLHSTKLADSRSAADVATSQILADHTIPEPEELRDLFRAYDIVERQDFSKLHRIVLGFYDNSNGEANDRSLQTALRCLPIDITDHSGRTALSWGAQRGDHQAVKRFLSEGTNVNRIDRE